MLRLDEALEQVPAHGGWRAGRGVLWWCWEVGMGIWAGVSLLPVGYTTMEMAMMYARNLKRAGRFSSRLTIHRREWQLYVTGYQHREIIIEDSRYSGYTTKGTSIKYNVISHRL